ncbi:hypothetical protein IFM89_015557 [Coptis chinensis]|uniref:Uncharacterized protein n=1 Tax=Coptis chinensis TaxID=261450 RepID=A0A835I480_9MAGN|nr:hypothetical protein IFM89_015557 [Coptis chinensis]
MEPRMKINGSDFGERMRIHGEGNHKVDGHPKPQFNLWWSSLNFLLRQQQHAQDSFQVLKQYIRISEDLHKLVALKIEKIADFLKVAQYDGKRKWYQRSVCVVNCDGHESALEIVNTGNELGHYKPQLYEPLTYIVSQDTYVHDWEFCRQSMWTEESKLFLKVEGSVEGIWIAGPKVCRVVKRALQKVLRGNVEIKRTKYLSHRAESWEKSHITMEI